MLHAAAGEPAPTSGAQPRVGLGHPLVDQAQAAYENELGAGRTVLTVLCDTGERYFSLAEHFRAELGQEAPPR